MATESKKVYFKGLNALRFIAASAVIFHHIEQYKFWKGMPSLWGKEGWVGVFVDGIGHKAVSFFFVLSGFLITYLLLAELGKTRTISLKKFYLRRILRIWPVYYLVLVLAFFVLPYVFRFEMWHGILEENFTVTLLAYLFILPNLARIRMQVPGANQAWSVGVEEQFYLIWPFFIRLFKNHIYKFLMGFLILKMIVQGVLLGVSDIGKMNMVYIFFTHLQIEQMAIGGLGAYWLFHKKTSILNFFYHPLVNVFSLLVFITFFTIDYHFFGISLLEGIVFLVIILNVSTNTRFKLNLEQNWMVTLGNISYGIYMYHTLCISILMAVLFKAGINENLTLYNILMYIFAPALTILVSYISYTYFETWFLKLKERFMVVKSATRSDS